MDEATRDELDEQIKELDEAMGKIEAARKPYDDALSAIYGVREALLEKHEVDIAGNCETCTALLFVGGQGHRSNEGEILFCADCSPTWNDIQAQWDEAADHDPDDMSGYLEAKQAHLDGGGRLTDKVLFEL